MNWELLKSPLSWVTVWLMLLIAALAGKYAIQLSRQIVARPTAAQ